VQGLDSSWARAPTARRITKVLCGAAAGRPGVQGAGGTGNGAGGLAGLWHRGRWHRGRGPIALLADWGVRLLLVRCSRKEAMRVDGVLLGADVVGRTVRK